MGVPTISVAGPRDDDYAPVSGDGGRRRVAVVAAVVIALALASVGGAGWYAGRQDAQIASEPPLIRAEPGLTKQRPAEAGGLEVPHLDVLVFEQLTPTAPSEPRVERLLPPPEAPVPPVTLRAPPPLDTGADAAAPQAPAATTVVTVPTPPRRAVSIETVPIPAPPETASAPVPAAAPVPPVATAEVTLAEPAATQAAPAAPPAGAPTEVAILPAAGPAVAAAVAGWRVQIGSFRDRQAGEAEWTRLQQKHVDLLGGLALHVQQADLSRGTFYRIQGGVFATRGAADTLCGQLKSRNQDCLVVQP